MDDHLAVRFHGSCRYWDGLAQKQLEPLAESGTTIARPWLLHQEETSKPQIDARSRPRPCKPHPSRRPRASGRCGNAKWFDRSWVGQCYGGSVGQSTKVVWTWRCLKCAPNQLRTYARLTLILASVFSDPLCPLNTRLD